MSKKIAENIRRFRREQQLQPQAVDALIGAEYRTISQIENGKRVPNEYELKKIAEALRVPVAWLKES